MNADMETERNLKKPSVFPGYGSYGFFFPSTDRFYILVYCAGCACVVKTELLIKCVCVIREKHFKQCISQLPLSPTKYFH